MFEPRHRPFITIPLLWTLLIALSVAWNMYQNYTGTLEKARIEARTIFEHNVAYRRWNAMYGGVYAEVSEKNQPNPYLSVRGRNVTTTNGRKLTLINPFRMTRQAYELLEKEFPHTTVNRTVSLNPLNPANAPDAWEKRALLAFEKGDFEVSEVTEINGEPYMRILKPYITVEGCLKCHSIQGYKVGDIRGAMSIAVPLAPYYTSARKTNRTIAVTHLVIWFFGTAGIVLFTGYRQRQQRRVAESEWKFRTLSEFSQDWEYWMTENKAIMYMSPSCEAITGYSREEFMNDPDLLHRIIHPNDRDLYPREMEPLPSSRRQEILFRIRTKQGAEKWLSHVSASITIEGRFLGRRVSNRDITDYKKMEEQLIQSQKMDSLGHLAGGIAHDFNNLLTVMKGSAFMLQEEIKDESGGIKQYIQHILDSAEMAQNLTSKLLVFSRKHLIKPETVSLNHIIKNVAELLKRIIGEDITLRIHYTDAEFPVFADPHQIEQVIMNLTTNAMDAMAGGGILTIETQPAVFDGNGAGSREPKPGTYMTLMVHDSGTGIDPKDIPHIFEPFYTTKEDKGTGLGLSMVYEIIKQHQGFIEVSSETGEGTTFRMYLPAATGQADTRSTEHAKEGREDFRGSGTILVVEDDMNMREFLKDILDKFGYAVILAADGDEAVAKYKLFRQGIDLVILDIILPKKNGKEVYDAIRQMNPDVPAFFVSGYTRDVLNEKGICGEYLEFIPKPVEVKMFLAKVRSLLKDNKNSPVDNS